MGCGVVMCGVRTQRRRKWGGWPSTMVCRCGWGGRVEGGGAEGDLGGASGTCKKPGTTLSLSEPLGEASVT